MTYFTTTDIPLFNVRKITLDTEGYFTLYGY